VADTVSIDRRFNGPPGSGHGGYTCGLIARRLEGPAEVTLRTPPPLDTELTVVEEDGALDLLDGETLVAEAAGVEDPFELAVPEPVGLPEAEAAREASPLHTEHPFRTCFVCGPDRRTGDGLRVIAGPVEGREDVIASPWEVSRALPVEKGGVSSEMVWSALDCPGGCALVLTPGIGTSVLGRMSARINAPIRPGESYVALGWPIEHDGRKHYTGSAIFNLRGEPLAVARATWIELRNDPLGARG
jgi:hypothetical protein